MMYKILKVIVLVCSFIVLFEESVGQVVQDGQCDPNIPLQTNFNLEEFLGTWYEIGRAQNPTQGGDCSYVDIFSGNNGLTYYNSAVNRNFLEEITGTATHESGTARFTLNLNNNALDFWILVSDYSNYALAYRCENINESQRRIYIWQLGRQQAYINELIPALMNVTLNNLFGITVEDLESVDQSEDACYILPVIEEGQPIVLPGACNPNIPVVQNFDVTRFLGTWNQIASYASENALGTCNRAQYSVGDGVVNVINSQVLNQALDTISGTATVISEDGSAKLGVTLEVQPNVFVDQELWILATDYDSYGVSYTCVDLPDNTKRIFSWIISRTRQLTPAAQIAVDAVVNSILDLNEAYYQITDQSDNACFYFPEPVPGQTVIFRGQCDLNIPAVANFDAVRYMGLWHDIESYPSEFQGGTCNNAYYTLNDVVDVFNTQVINQTLDTINGIAVPVSEDGSAKLRVSFPIAGTDFITNTSYWVLATDYDTYSLVYTCENIDEDTRLVYSWKLSRTKQLTNAAITAINNVVNTVPVLDQRYFLPRDQSEAGCFYFPEPQPGVPVIFPGQCDDSIQAVAGFNFAQFQGTWYEIEAYPKDFQPGQCVNHVFGAGAGNTLNLVSSAIVDQFLEVSTSTVSLVSLDASGRLEIVLNAGTNNEIRIPFWILSTDYSDYALAYSCVNQNTDFRAIYSWKLSRSQQLSALANTAINQVISTIQVLDNGYFETIDQSDEACFFLPELAPGEPVILVGQCDPNITVVQNFDAARYQGLWHLVESYPSEFQDGACNDATYTIQDDGSVLVFNTQVIGQTLDTITGRAVVASQDGSAKLEVTFPTAPFPIDYWVLDTDYDSYSLIYSCVNLNADQRQVWSWKMGRTRSLTNAASTAINQVIDTVNVLNNRYYEIIDNSDAACFYYPEPNGTPVTFRGQCDENVNVVQNFDPTRYEGLWYDIDSYPQAFQDGTCATATYTLVDGGVDVFNTQVINQRLDTIEGFATVASDDGSAKLNVSFVLPGTNILVFSPYWVLDTDYDSYSLVYACQNIASDSRSVSSWKLSRQKTLSAGAVTNINNIINSIDVLREDYYVNKDHTDDGCFYFPEPVAGEPVVFPGQCDDSIQAVPNFSLNEFQGIWHEIETYPKDDETGQCVNHLYSLGTANTLDLVSSSVTDQVLQMTNSNVRFTSVDGSGRLAITITTGGTVVEIPFWILSTDYSSYALAYSCINLNNDFRSIYSWKLSRTKQLTAAANTAINNVINNVQVLDNVYFETIDQSDEACFFLPDVAPGEPVIFVGQCDLNVPVVQNFDAARYLGLWHLIESYPSEFQDGECNDATYTLQTDGSVLVFNTQVINETLDTITGQAIANPDGSGKLTVTFPTTPFPIEYWVIDTDYESYTLIYSCANINTEQRQVWSWKMSRTRTLSAAASNAINQAINTVNVLDNRYFEVIDNSDAACFYYPEPNGNAVVFRGQCDESIQVVPNFDVARYLGQWYDIESYPQEFQDGSCATALYSLGDGVVDVYNTQVVNQQLDFINGTAVVNSDDGSAKLLVTFPVAGTDVTVDFPYWILATDYDSYSIVYSCINLDAEYRRVTSWKLSRERSLPAAAQTAVTEVFSRVPVLRQQYFEETGHSAEDCFFYPDNFGGPVILDGQCPDPSEVDLITNFNPTQFIGTWHQIERFPSELENGQCSSSILETGNLNTININQNIINNERLFTASGTGTYPNDGRGILNTVISSEVALTELPLYILDTDYTGFALVYSCQNIGTNSKQIFSWKLSRSREGLSQAAIDRINVAVSNNVDLFEGYYETTDQSNDACFYYPEFDPLPDAIVLPGPCDESIRGIPNFNAANYLGLWYETARYPQPSQAGECNRADYTSGATSVTVFNSQVVNRTLQIQIGSAVVASNDGSGQLEVTFVVDGGTNIANYFILATDYTDFSLVYSCRNLPSGERQIASWKLSRQPTLSNQANLIINGVIDSTQGLLEDYYVSTSQTDEACFYVPEVQENENVLFRGQCEDITGVAGFNIQNYLGWWHEIERYPTENDMGNCTSSQFSQIGTSYQVVDTEVFGTSAQVESSAVTAFADGRLRRDLGNGNFVDTWVLATDYETYSLLYSCVNVGTTNRLVWSAKHSKVRELTAAAQAVMAPIIENNEVLYPQFYLPVDQSDSACFHYPEITGNQVILPGQCDDNIPVVQQFDAVQYSGTWFQIERYPQIHETGNCTGARYTPDEETGVVTVVNWEVVDGELETIEGNATVTSTDGSARLNVVLPIRESETGETISTPLYVLTTDYVEYSLAYSCLNVNQFQRRIGVWKLSRSRDMPPTGNVAINAYMATREELYQDYFLQVGQSDECEEPSSSALIKSSIIVLLLCGILQMLL